MSGNISRESWSRCEQPSMLYDTIRNPSAPRLPPKSQAVLSPGKDTIETVQQRLNREMLERLHSKGHHLPHDSYVAVVQVGKYLFLALMLPPYLCFYGLPKWILLQLLPQLTEVAKTTLFRIGTFFVDLSNQVLDLMRGMIDQTVGYFLRTNKERFSRAWEKIMHAGASAAQSVRKGISKVTQSIESVKKSILEYFSQVSEKFLEMGRSAYGKFKSASREMLEPISSIIAKSAKIIQETLQQKGKSLFGPMGEAYLEASRQVEAAKQKIISSIRKVTDPITSKAAEAISTTYKNISGSAAILLNPAMALVKENYEKAVEAFKKNRREIEDRVKASASLVQTYSAAALAAVADQVRYAWQIVPFAFNIAGNGASKLLPKRIKERFSQKRDTFQKWKGAAGRAAAAAGRGVKEVTAFAGKGVAFGLEGLKRLLKILLGFVYKFFIRILELPKKLSKVAGIIVKASAYVLSRLGFTLQILVALMWALCVYGVYLVNSRDHKEIC